MVTLYNGVSGIKTNQYGMDVTANNIANANAVGFKNSQAEFKDIFYQTNIVGGTNPVYSQVGLGSTVAATALDVSQGSFQNTDNAFDLAIQGDGWFSVTGTPGISGQNVYYTRAGQFMRDVNGDLVNSAGYYLLGTSVATSPAQYSQAAKDKLGPNADPNALTVPMTSNLEFSPTQSKINLPDTLYMPPEPTSHVDFKGVLTSEQNFGFVPKDLNMENAVFTTTATGLANLSANVTDTPEFKDFQKGNPVIVSFTNEKGESLNARASIKEDGSFEVANFDISKLADPGYGDISANAKNQDFPAKLLAPFVATPTYANDKASINVPSTDPVLIASGALPGDELVLTFSDPADITKSVSTSVTIAENGGFSLNDFDISGLGLGAGVNPSFSASTKARTNVSLNLENAELKISDDGAASLNATKANVPELEKLRAGDQVEITFTNKEGKNLTATATFNGNELSLNADVKTLARSDRFAGITATATSEAKEEVPQTAKFTAGLYSSTGYDNTLTINLTKRVPTDPQNIIWDMAASVTDKDGNELSASTGALTFNGSGALISNTLGALSNGGTPLEINLGSFYDPTKPNSGFDGIVVGAGASRITHQQRNGYQDGLLTSYAVSDTGTILAQFSNGHQAAVAKVPLFHFQNDQGLASDGGILFTQTANSGQAFMYTDANGRLTNGAKIASHMLENSNVNLGTEMTMLIVQQRAYEASAKSITTGDQMLQRAINMKNDR